MQERIDSYRRELQRSREEIKNLELDLKGSLSEADRGSKERQREILLNEMKRLDGALEDLTGQQQAKRHCSSFTVTVPGVQVQEKVLWDAEVVNKKVPRQIIDVNSLLAPSRPLLAELRWLHLKYSATRQSLKQVKDMRKARQAGQRDLEVPYHALLLLFYQAAARGQAHLEFLAEDHRLPAPREDIQGFVNGARKEPQECKTECVYNLGPDSHSTQSIDDNAEAFGKLLQVSIVCRFTCIL